MRIENHPILEFNKGKEIKFYFNGEQMYGYESDTIASALHALDIRVLGESIFKHRPRGFYCAIGNCSSCFMIVNGEPNVRTCVVPLKEGMRVELQKGKGKIL